MYPNPTPVVLAQTAPKVDVRYEEVRGCQVKNRYPSKLQARLVAARRTQECGKPLRVYLCQFCFEYHLTSQVSGPEGDPTTNAEWIQRGLRLDLTRGGRKRHARRRHRSEPDPAEVLPAPHPATTEQIAEFFARHQRSA